MISETRRADIATALSLVDDVTGHAWMPDAPGEGDAWPMWRGLNFDDGVPGLAPMHRWAVIVVLPPDQRAADTWIAGHAADLFSTLATEAYVEGMEPANVQTDAGQLRGLIINLRGE